MFVNSGSIYIYFTFVVFNFFIKYLNDSGLQRVIDRSTLIDIIKQNLSKTRVRLQYRVSRKKVYPT